MKFSYYPGCTLSTTAKELDECARLSAAALGIELEELDSWQCCGGVYPLGTDEIASKLSAVRALSAARDRSRPLVTLCSACHHVLKRVNHDMRTQPDIRDRANRYLSLDTPYHGEGEVIHFLELLRDRVGFDALRERVTRPLSGVKIGAYYGCLLLRPSGVMAFDDAENPTILEDFIRALGAEPVIYPCRNECCGGYISLREGETAKKMNLLEAKEETLKLKNEHEKENRERRAELQKYEQRVLSKEESVDKKADALEKRENSLTAKENEYRRQH